MSVPQIIRELVERFERQLDAYRSPQDSIQQFTDTWCEAAVCVFDWSNLPDEWQEYLSGHNPRDG